MHDVLVLTIPLRPGMTYPSVNHSGADGARFGRKSDAYRALAFDVEEAGKQAVADGWETITYPCKAWITRYITDARITDPINLAQCEWNALTRAGVWSDDSLVETTVSVQPRSPGPDRVVIVIQRLSPPVGAQPRLPRGASKIPKGAGKAVDAAWNPGEPIPDGYAALGGKLVRREEALRLVNSSAK